MAKTDTQAAKKKTSAPKAKAKPSRSGEATKAKAKPAGPPRQPGVERRKNHPSRAHLGFMQVILTQNIPQGQIGDVLKVRPGFARNYLVPQGLATFATQANLRLLEKHRQRQKALEEARRADLLNLAAQIAQRSLTIEANANADGHLYGSVNADQIAEALKKLGFPVEAEHVRIEGPLKELGLYTIRIALGQEIEGEVKLWVVPTHTEEGLS